MEADEPTTYKPKFAGTFVNPLRSWTKKHHKIPLGERSVKFMGESRLLLNILDSVSRFN